MQNSAVHLQPERNLLPRNNAENVPLDYGIPTKGHLDLTFWGGTGTVGGDLPHAASVAAQCHEPRDDGRLPVTHAAYNYGAVVLCGRAGPQGIFQLLKEPISSHEHRVGGDAGHLKQQGLEHDVHGFYYHVLSNGVLSINRSQMALCRPKSKRVQHIPQGVEYELQTTWFVIPPFT
ncbi:hypothetical protein EYF80_005237 [Liparis tanakae]|uniref:Uncharacterized protein n=1 Tax=Liparis tanakae TaxID=230148 RepID=A0A4Z2J3F0_9TELE|nr:hypothetical protein EYF80_005237 [Liparis tanakae]